MSTDLEIIDELERVLGEKLARRHMVLGALPDTRFMKDPRLRPEDASPDCYDYECFVNSPSLGCFHDDQGNVVGLSLTFLDLAEIPEPVLRLRNLRRLNLGANRLSVFPELILQLPNLEILQLTENCITHLPKSILDRGFDVYVSIYDSEFLESGIILDENPLQSPPREIVEQGMDAIRAYFDSLEGKPLPLNEVKVLLVGDGGAGKTSLVKQLIGKRFDPAESQTHGINIDQWTLPTDGKKVLINFWDFGGQEIMHATHQFFLSERSVYVLVLDGRKEEDAEYWLKHIESFGGDSPILVVLNKMDQNPGFDINRRFLQAKYKGIVGFYPVSCMAGHGIAEFRKGLEEALRRVRIIGTLWPAPWFRVKKRLAQMKDPFITYESYCSLCAAESLGDEADQGVLVRFLHDLGVIVHFHDFHLQDTHVLDPRWLTGAVYRIINSRELADGKGVLKLECLRQLLPSSGKGPIYPVDKHAYVIALMKKFELCYEIDGRAILVPDLLQVQEPAIDFDYARATTIHIDYDFLPKSIIPRFIVKKHRDIKDELRWRCPA